MNIFTLVLFGIKNKALNVVDEAMRYIHHMLGKIIWQNFFYSKYYYRRHFNQRRGVYERIKWENTPQWEYIALWHFYFVIKWLKRQWWNDKL